MTTQTLAHARGGKHSKMRTPTKPRAGDEVRVERDGRVWWGRVLGTAGENGSTRYAIRTTFNERVFATRAEIAELRREDNEAVRRAVIRDAVREGGQLSEVWRRRLGLL